MTRIRTERGSVIMGLLVAIIASGLVATAATRAIQTQRSVQFDRDFSQVLHGAEGGVNEAMDMLKRQVNPGQSGYVPVQVDPPSTYGAVSVVWSATFTPPNEWTIVSTGTRDGVDRIVTATLEERQRFPMPLFADSVLGFQGNNHVDSYTATPLGIPQWCTGMGIVGTNDDAHFNGGSPATAPCRRDGGKRTVDQVVLYDWAANPAAATPPHAPRCEHVGGSNCVVVGAHPSPSLVNEVRTFPEVGTLVSDKVVACQAAGRYFDTWNSDAPPAASGAPDDVLPAGEWCVNKLYFRDNTTIQGTSANPTIFYVTGELGVTSNNKRINCPALICLPLTSAPQATALQVYYSGTTPISFKPGTHVTAAIQAPSAACGAHPSNAALTLYGSLVCGAVNNVGNWELHYDERLGRIGTGEFDITTWAEESL